MSEYSMQFWVMVGTVATSIATVGLVIGAFMAWHKAKQSLDQMHEDAVQTERRFKLDVTYRTSQEQARRQNDATNELLSAASDVVSSTNVSIDAIYEAGMNLRKANLRFTMVHEVTHKLESLEEFCAILTQVAKSRFSNVAHDPTYPKILANRGFELLFRSLSALHRGEIDMANFLDGLYTFVEDVRGKHAILLGVAMHMDGDRE